MIIDPPDVFLNDFGVPITDGSVTGRGILEQPTEIIAGGMVLTTDYQLTARADQFGGKLRGDVMTVNGQSFMVREARLVDDGLFVTIYLSKQ
jgi:hypothetical protein